MLEGSQSLSETEKALEVIHYYYCSLFCVHLFCDFSCCIICSDERRVRCKVESEISYSCFIIRRYAISLTIFKLLYNGPFLSY